MSDEQTMKSVQVALEASGPGWRRCLLERTDASVRAFVAQITARLALLSAGELLYVESAVEEQPDGSVSVEIRAFSPAVFVQIAGSVDRSGAGEVAFSTATPRSAVTRVAVRDVRMGRAGVPVGAMFDLTFANGEVATIGGQAQDEPGEADGLGILQSSLLALGQRG